MNQSKDNSSIQLGKECEIYPNVYLGYKYLGWKNPTIVGDKSRIHSGTVIYADTVIGKRFTCGHNVIIRAHCEIGDRVVILHGSTLEGMIKIGKGVKIMAHVYIPSRTVIGELVFIGPGVNILNASLPMRSESLSGVTIGNNVVVGGGVTLAPGVTIGDNVFIGAGALVLDNIPSNSLALGSPAKLKPLPEKFGKRNDPKQIFTGLDLWNKVDDDKSWMDEDFFGKEDWLRDHGI